jgi:hypothetical protein
MYELPVVSGRPVIFQYRRFATTLSSADILLKLRQMPDAATAAALSSSGGR